MSLYNPLMFWSCLASPLPISNPCPFLEVELPHPTIYDITLWGFWLLMCVLQSQFTPFPCFLAIYAMKCLHSFLLYSPLRFMKKAKVSVSQNDSFPYVQNSAFWVRVFHMVSYQNNILLLFHGALLIFCHLQIDAMGKEVSHCSFDLYTWEKETHAVIAHYWQICLSVFESPELTQSRVLKGKRLDENLDCSWSLPTPQAAFIQFVRRTWPLYLTHQNIFTNLALLGRN